MAKFYRTQWVQSIVNTTINNGTTLNLLTLVTDASKSANGCDTDYNALSIASNGIIVPYQGIMSHRIRVNVSILSGSVQTMIMELRRVSDNSVITGQQIARNPDQTLNTVVFESYTGGPTDPFVTGGFYVALTNSSGTNLTITGTINLYIITTPRF